MTALFTATDLLAMRALNDANLPHTAAVQAFTEVDNGGGDTSQAWSTVSGLGAVPCRVAASTPSEVATAGVAKVAAQLYTVAFPFGTAVRAPHRLVVTHGGALASLPNPATLGVVGPLPRTYAMQETVIAEAVG